MLAAILEVGRLSEAESGGARPIPESKTCSERFVTALKALILGPNDSNRLYENWQRTRVSARDVDTCFGQDKADRQIHTKNAKTRRL